MVRYEIPVECIAKVDLNGLPEEYVYYGERKIVVPFEEDVYQTWCATGEIADFDNFRLENNILTLTACTYHNVEAFTLEEAKELAITDAKRVHAIWNKTVYEAEFIGFIIHDEYIYNRDEGYFLDEVKADSWKVYGLKITRIEHATISENDQ
jgi:hypothetical protein